MEDCACVDKMAARITMMLSKFFFMNQVLVELPNTLNYSKEAMVILFA